MANLAIRYMAMKRLVVLILTGIISLSGCYTVLKHPKVERESYLPPEITHRDSCTECHRDYHYYSPENPYILSAPYTSTQLSDWLYYYQYPWWLEDFYYPDQYGESEPTETPPVDRRGFGRREALEPYRPTVAPQESSPGFQLRKQSAADTQQPPQSQKPEAPALSKRRHLDEKSSSSTEQRSPRRTRKKKSP